MTNKGKDNVLVGALSRKHILVSTLTSKLLDFESLKSFYPKDPIFAQIYHDCEAWVRDHKLRDKPPTLFSIFDGWLFKNK